MFIVWSGKGLLVVLSLIIGVICGFVLGDWLKDAISSNFVFMLCLCIAALCNHFFSKRLISDKVKTYTDNETGEIIGVRDNSSLFFLRNQYWTWIFVFLAAVFFVMFIIEQF